MLPVFAFCCCFDFPDSATQKMPEITSEALEHFTIHCKTADNTFDPGTLFVDFFPHSHHCHFFHLPFKQFCILDHFPKSKSIMRRRPRNRGEDEIDLKFYRPFQGNMRINSAGKKTKKLQIKKISNDEAISLSAAH